LEAPVLSVIFKVTEVPEAMSTVQVREVPVCWGKLSSAAADI